MVFYLSPLEHLYFDVFLPRNAWMEICCTTWIVLGSMYVVHSQRTLRANYSDYESVKRGQERVHRDLYPIIRHPVCAGYLSMAFGLCFGDSSIARLAFNFFVLLPAVVYRIGVKEHLLAEHFGDMFDEYIRKTKRLIPGIW